MEANLYPIGELGRPHTSIYVVVDGDACEIERFLLGGEDESAVDGMLTVLHQIHRFGTQNLSSAIFKQFRPRKKKEKLYQIRKGDWRISCCRYPDNGGSLLLLTCFRKTKDTETRQYDRALRVKQRFDSNPKWR